MFFILKYGLGLEGSLGFVNLESICNMFDFLSFFLSRSVSLDLKLDCFRKDWLSDLTDGDLTDCTL